MKESDNIYLLPAIFDLIVEIEKTDQATDPNLVSSLKKITDRVNGIDWAGINNDARKALENLSEDPYQINLNNKARELKLLLDKLDAEREKNAPLFRGRHSDITLNENHKIRHVKSNTYVDMPNGLFWQFSFLSLVEKTSRNRTNRKTIKSVIAEAESKYKKTLRFKLNRKSRKNFQFDHVEKLRTSLFYLGNEFWRWKKGDRKGLTAEQINQELHKSCGFFYKQRQSETTVGKYRDYYTLKHKGQSITLHEHIGYGTRTRPIRIAFAWDNEEEKIVIGYIGQHQRTDSGNG